MTKRVKNPETGVLEGPLTWPGMKVRSRDGKLIGEATGAMAACQLEGCRGLRISVRWPDGRLTKPCSKGMGFKITLAEIE